MLDGVQPVPTTNNPLFILIVEYDPVSRRALLQQRVQRFGAGAVLVHKALASCIDPNRVSNPGVGARVVIIWIARISAIPLLIVPLVVEVRDCPADFAREFQARAHGVDTRAGEKTFGHRSVFRPMG